MRRDAECQVPEKPGMNGQPSRNRTVSECPNNFFQDASDSLRNVSNDQFYRIKMCPFVVKGSCWRGQKCTYAHSSEQLVTSVSLEKTKLCFNWLAGKCSSDSCAYAHGEKELKATSDYFKTALCKVWLQGKCPNGFECRHAHGEQEMRQRRYRQTELEKMAKKEGISVTELINYIRVKSGGAFPNSTRPRCISAACENISDMSIKCEGSGDMMDRCINGIKNCNIVGENNTIPSPKGSGSNNNDGFFRSFRNNISGTDKQNNCSVVSEHSSIDENQLMKFCVNNLKNQVIKRDINHDSPQSLKDNNSVNLLKHKNNLHFSDKRHGFNNSRNRVISADVNCIVDKKENRKTSDSDMIFSVNKQMDDQIAPLDFKHNSSVRIIPFFDESKKSNRSSVDNWVNGTNDKVQEEEKIIFRKLKNSNLNFPTDDGMISNDNCNPINYNNGPTFITDETNCEKTKLNRTNRYPEKNNSANGEVAYQKTNYCETSSKECSVENGVENGANCASLLNLFCDDLKGNMNISIPNHYSNHITTPTTPITQPCTPKVGLFKNNLLRHDLIRSSNTHRLNSIDTRNLETIELDGNKKFKGIGTICDNHNKSDLFSKVKYLRNPGTRDLKKINNNRYRPFDDRTMIFSQKRRNSYLDSDLLTTCSDSECMIVKRSVGNNIRYCNTEKRPVFDIRNSVKKKVRCSINDDSYNKNRNIQKPPLYNRMTSANSCIIDSKITDGNFSLVGNSEVLSSQINSKTNRKKCKKKKKVQRNCLVDSSYKSIYDGEPKNSPKYSFRKFLSTGRSFCDDYSSVRMRNNFSTNIYPLLTKLQYRNNNYPNPIVCRKFFNNNIVSYNDKQNYSTSCSIFQPNENCKICHLYSSSYKLSLNDSTKCYRSMDFAPTNISYNIAPKLCNSPEQQSNINLSVESSSTKSSVKKDELNIINVNENVNENVMYYENENSLNKSDDSVINDLPNKKYDVLCSTSSFNNSVCPINHDFLVPQNQCRTEQNYSENSLSRRLSTSFNGNSFLPFDNNYPCCSSIQDSSMNNHNSLCYGSPYELYYYCPYQPSCVNLYDKYYETVNSATQFVNATNINYNFNPFNKRHPSLNPSTIAFIKQTAHEEAQKTVLEYLQQKMSMREQFM